MQELRQRAPPEVLAFAAQMSLRSAGKLEESKLISEAVFTTPTRASKISAAYKEHQISTITPYTPREALSLMLEADLSRDNYQTLRTEAKSKGAKLYPSYKKVRIAKQECYPSEENVTVTESKAEVKLQALLDLTVRRIIELQENVLVTLPSDVYGNLVLVSKWGCDGSSGHAAYKQKSNQEVMFDVRVLMMCLVPLQMYALSPDHGKKIIVWQNPRPSSTRYCRPIKLEFAAETPTKILAEKKWVDKQITNLQPTSLEHTATAHLKVHHQLAMTMIDGKTCNALTETASAQRCNMCGVTPTNVNNIDLVVKRAIDERVSQYGLSTLHAYVRFLEWFLHLSYRLPYKSWFITKQLKENIQARKLKIQGMFKSKMGLLIGIVLQGKGTTHDGNTARRFFDDALLSAEITGVNEELITKCATILRVLSSGFAVDIDAFRAYALDTARLYVKEYSWYPMPTSPHKILIHGADVISIALLPIGMLSEESQEARNKDFRRFRENRCRKTSRVESNRDLLNIFLTSSDPIISSLRHPPQKKFHSITPEMLALLKEIDV